MGPSPMGKVALVEMRTRSRLPAMALPRISSEMPCGIDVGGVEDIDAGVEADVDEARGFGDVGVAPGLEEFVAAAERAGAEAENGDLQTRIAELSVFHGEWMLRKIRWVQRNYFTGFAGDFGGLRGFQRERRSRRPNIF